MKITYNVFGPKRKELANAIGKLIGVEPIYKKLPTYAYEIGCYILDKEGVLIVSEDTNTDEAFRLVDALIAEYGFIPEEPLDVLFPEEENNEEVADEDEEEPEAETAEVIDSDEAEDEDAEDDNTEDEEEPREGTDTEELLSVGVVFQTEATEEDKAESVANATETAEVIEATTAPENAPETPEVERVPEEPKAPETPEEAPVEADNPAEDNSGDADADESADTDGGDDDDDDETHLTLSMPKEKFSPDAIERLRAIVASKQTILKRVFETDDLSIVVTDDQIQFPWFTLHKIDGEIDAYAKFVFAIAKRALTSSRISSVERPTDNEKFTMRLFLNSLGFQGEDFKFARRFLIRNLEGNGAWRYGNGPSGSSVDLEPPTVFVPEKHKPKKAEDAVD